MKLEDLKVTLQKHRKKFMIAGGLSLLAVVSGGLLFAGISQHNRSLDSDTMQSSAIIKNKNLAKIDQMDPKKIDIHGKLANQLTQSEKNHSVNFQKARLWHYAMTGSAFPSKKQTKDYFYANTNVPRDVQKQALDWIPESVWQRNCDIMTEVKITNSFAEKGKYDEFIKRVMTDITEYGRISPEAAKNSLKRMNVSESHPYGTKSIVSGNIDDDIAYGQYVRDHPDDFDTYEAGRYLAIADTAIKQKYGKYQYSGEVGLGSDEPIDYKTDFNLTQNHVTPKKPEPLHRTTYIK